jgi:hypothetical protein
LKTRFIIPVLLVATASFAQSTTDQLKTLNSFVGTWKCTGKAFASDMGPEHATTANVTVKWILNAKWLEVRYAEDKNSRNPNPMAIVAQWGYDAGKKTFVSGTVDNMGGYAVEESPGWSGDQLVFTGASHMGAMTMQGRDVFVRKSDSEVTHAFEMQDNTGAWKRISEEDCKK